MVSSELTRQLSERQRKLESGEITQIGVNAFLGEIGLAPRAAHQEDSVDYDAIARERIASIVDGAQSRDNRAVAAGARETGARGREPAAIRWKRRSSSRAPAAPSANGPRRSSA